MAAPETTKKIDPPVELPKCLYATEAPTPDEYGSIIAITVGDGATERKFQVYEGLLKHYSGYFRAALSDRWPEGKLKMTNLPEDNPKVFSAFFHWLSIGKLYARLTPDGKIPLDEETIAEIYVFGDARDVPELCNAAIDVFFQKNIQEWTFPLDILGYIYTNTSENSPLRKYMIDFGVETHKFEHIKTDQAKFPKDYLINLIYELQSRNEKLAFKSVLGLTKYAQAKKLEICSKYHNHSTPNAVTET